MDYTKFLAVTYLKLQWNKCKDFPISLKHIDNTINQK